MLWLQLVIRPEAGYAKNVRSFLQCRQENPVQRLCSISITNVTTVDAV
jgi:hypothetical protein